MECSRRIFIDGIGAFTAVALAGCGKQGAGERPVVRFGMVTDRFGVPWLVLAVKG